MELYKYNQKVQNEIKIKHMSQVWYMHMIINSYEFNFNIANKPGE